MSPPAIRTFLAVTLPGDLATTLNAIQNELRPRLPAVRWVSREHLHLTLAFLGDVPADAAELVDQAAAEAASFSAPFELACEGLGVFPRPSRPSVLWAALLGGATPQLERLQHDLVSSLRARQVQPADDRFHPHITLGRVARGMRIGPLDSLIDSFKARAFGTLPVHAIAVMESSLGPGGPTYRQRSLAPLSTTAPSA